MSEKPDYLSREAQLLVSTFLMPKTMTYHTPAHCPEVTLNAYRELVEFEFLIEDEIPGKLQFRGTEKAQDMARLLGPLVLAGEYSDLKVPLWDARNV